MVMSEASAAEVVGGGIGDGGGCGGDVILMVTIVSLLSFFNVCFLLCSCFALLFMADHAIGTEFRIALKSHAIA